MKLAHAFTLLLALWLNAASADELLMIRSSQNFEDAMTTLQATIAEHGYKVTRVQRVDVGLEAKGYKTDRYRIVFYGKPGEIEMLAAKYPKLIPYLPQSVAIFAEEGNTILTTARPALLEQFYPEPELKPIFDRWEKDLVEIMDDVREAK
ncbi:MAG: DUF302 domain-containing protein [Hydrogenophilales bacterium]|nr:DUF302 domain-containing protein [Hydrogenophilales bacterium]